MSSRRPADSFNFFAILMMWNNSPACPARLGSTAATCRAVTSRGIIHGPPGAVGTQPRLRCQERQQSEHRSAVYTSCTFKDIFHRWWPAWRRGHSTAKDNPRRLPHRRAAGAEERGSEPISEEPWPVGLRRPAGCGHPAPAECRLHLSSLSPTKGFPALQTDHIMML